MAIETTTRPQFPNCFLCDRNRHFTISAKLSKDLSYKIGFLTNTDFSIFIQENKTLGICRTCVEHINSSYRFVVNLRESLLSYSKPDHDRDSKRQKLSSHSQLIKDANEKTIYVVKEGMIPKRNNTFMKSRSASAQQAKTTPQKTRLYVVREECFPLIPCLPTSTDVNGLSNEKEHRQNIDDVSNTEQPYNIIERAIKVEVDDTEDVSAQHVSQEQESEATVAQPQGASFDTINTEEKLDAVFSDEDIPEHICHQCGKTYKYKRNLVEHERIHTGTTPYHCCGQGFNTKVMLHRHRCTHHGLDKNHVCPKCGRSFATKTDLNIHRKRENKIKPLKCDQCGHTTTTRSEMQQHQNTHQQNSSHRCPTCGIIYKHASSLSRHRSQRHGDCIKR